MPNKKNEKVLDIAIDYGNDGAKIDINKKLYKYPAYIIKPEEELRLTGSTSELISYREKSGAVTEQYIVGSYAKKLMNTVNPIESNKLNDELKGFDEEPAKYISSKERITVVRAAICYALVKYSNESDNNFNINELNDWDIHIGLALPDSKVVDEVIGHYKSRLATKTTIEFAIDKNVYDITLDISFDNIKILSQVLASFLNICYGDNGEQENIEAMMQKLPAVIVDGGYRTQGKAVIMKDSGLIVQSSESNTEYAMIEIDVEVANKINEIAKKKELINYNEIKYYEIQDKIRDKESFSYSVKTDDEIGSRKEVISYEKIKQLHEETVTKFANNYARYLINSPEINDAKSIIIAGGTGKAYAAEIERMIEMYTNNTENKIDVILQELEYNGKIVTPEYAIVTGLHKTLLSIYSPN